MFIPGTPDKSGPSAQGALGPYAPTHSLRRFGHQRKSDAGAGKVLGSVQTLKDLEHAFMVRGIEANAVVAHPEHPTAALMARPDLNDRRPAVSAELDRVANQVAQHHRDAFAVQ
ncbi:MAG: hypothetical protein R3E42_07030 [Burkholderiaceae bacterium]